MADMNPQLRLFSDSYNDKGYSSTNHLSTALLQQSELLSPVVTHLYGSDKNFGSKNFPLSFVTEGLGNTRGIKTMEYRYPVIGRPKKSSRVAKSLYTAGQKPGVGHSEFKITFEDRWFHKSLTIISSSRTVARIKSNPVKVGTMWEYTCELVNPSSTAFCPLKDLQAGAKWGRMVATVGAEASRGVESRSYSPGMATNQLSLVRDSYSFRGNVQNKVMVIEIKADGKVYKFWSEWELYLRNLEFKEKCETLLWYSQYNKDESGEIHNIDEDSDEVVPLGAGVLQQIPNSSTYSFLTTKKLESIITDTFFNASDAQAVNVEIFSGTGGLREADRAMKAASSGFTLVDSKQIKGEGWNMMFGSYFSVYRHIDGHTVTFRHLPLMDGGVMADISDPHPIDGLPLESYNMYILDNSVYDGQKNIQYVYEIGREMIEFAVAGVKVPLGYPNTSFRATDRDASSIHWMKSQGIQIMKPTNCFKLFCDIS